MRRWRKQPGNHEPPVFETRAFGAAIYADPGIEKYCSDFHEPAQIAGLYVLDAICDIEDEKKIPEYAGKSGPAERDDTITRRHTLHKCPHQEPALDEASAARHALSGKRIN